MVTLTRHKPDFEQFLKALGRKQRPDHLPFYEHIASGKFIAERMGVPMDMIKIENPDFWRLYVDFWVGLGFDCVPMEIPYTKTHEPEHKGASEGSEARAVIASMEDFERHDWPTEDEVLRFEYFEQAAACLPEGVRIVGGVCGGPFEHVSQMLGVQGLSLALYAQPELVEAMFDKVGRLHLAALRQLATMEGIGALRQGDDLGFKTSTFLSPEHLRRFVFPIYKEMVAIAHGAGMPFILHSCGNLAEVYDDLIDDVGIDGKHSFEDVIMPVTEFKKQYGARVTPLGGLDVDKICRLGEADLRTYTRETIGRCFDDGFWALGTGNSLTDYMPVEQYLIVLDEAQRFAG